MQDEFKSENKDDVKKVKIILSSNTDIFYFFAFVGFKTFFKFYLMSNLFNLKHFNV
jgi:hypothetical protein